MSQSSSSNANIQDIITEESPPAYTQYPNLGEQSMAFGPNRPFGDNTTQNFPQYQQNTPPNQQILPNQQNIPPNQQNIPPNQHINRPPLQNHNAYNYINNNSVGGGNVIYNVTRPTFTTTNTVIPTSTLRYPPGYFCLKCDNTGYKRSGRTCKKCWRTFASHTYSSPGINNNITQISYPQQNNNVLYVRPGDPSIGGWLCSNCHGKFIIKIFFL